MGRLLLFPLLIGLTIVVGNCSPSTSSLRIQVDPSRLPRFTPGGSRVYDAYLVTISGPGISPTVSSGSIGDYAPTCAADGISSKLLSDVQITEGVKLSVPGGVGRKIQVLGVATTLGSAVIGKDIPALFDEGRIPRIYELAVADDVSLLTDRKLQLTATGNNPTNILGNCFKEESSDGSTTPTGPVNAVAIAVTSFNLISLNSNRIQTLLMDPATGEMTLKSSILDSGGVWYDYLAVTPSGGRLLAWQPTGGYNKTFDVGIDGTLQYLGPGSELGAFIDAKQVAFSTSGQYVITRGDSFLGFRKFDANGVLVPNEGASNISADFNTFFLVGQRAFGTFIFGSGIRTFSGLLPATHILEDTTGFQPLSAGASPAYVNGQAALTSKGLYVMYRGLSTSDLRVEFFKFDGTANLIHSGSLASATTADSSSARFAVSPDSSMLFVKTQLGQMVGWKLNSDGSIGAQTITLGALSGLHALTVDPTSQYLLTVHDLGTACFVSAFPINSTAGTLGTPTTATGLAEKLENIVAIPIR